MAEMGTAEKFKRAIDDVATYARTMADHFADASLNLRQVPLPTLLALMGDGKPGDDVEVSIVTARVALGGLDAALRMCSDAVMSRIHEHVHAERQRRRADEEKDKP